MTAIPSATGIFALDIRCRLKRFFGTVQVGALPAGSSVSFMLSSTSFDNSVSDTGSRFGGLREVNCSGLERITGILGTYLYKDSNCQRQKTNLYLTCFQQIGWGDYIYNNK